MSALLKNLLWRQKGLTLLEMAVVGAILSILAGLTAVAVTGSSSQASQAALSSDLSEVAKAISNYSGQHPPRSQYPTLTGCLPGQVRDSATSTCMPGGVEAQPWPVGAAPSSVATWLSDTANWTAIIWGKAYSQAGEVKYFDKDFLGKLPRHAFEHNDTGLSACTRIVSDPDNVLTSGIKVPDCAGSGDTSSTECTSALAPSNAPVWVMDRVGVPHVVLVEGKY
jgi:prepilin-type N-terminal cleavage/methylation domain-containing protein